MATSKENLFNILDTAEAKKKQWDAGVTFNRLNEVPLDKYSVFKTYAEASAYALTGAISYPGQTLAVIGDLSTDLYFIDTDGSLKAIATGGDAGALESKLNQEISDRKTADSYLSSTLSSHIDGCDLSIAGISSIVQLSVSNLESNLSINVLTATPEGDAYATYHITQGGTKIGASINIPKDKVISSAYLVDVKGKPDGAESPVSQMSAFEVSYNGELQKTAYRDQAETSAVFWSIDNAYSGPQGGGDGPYLRITVTNAEAVPIYIPMPQLVDTYVGVRTDTVNVEINAKTREISAFVNEGSVDTKYIAADAVTNAKIADDAVQTENIKDLAVTTTKINDYAVLSSKIADSAVITSKIADKAVTTSKIDDSAVTSDKLGNSSVISEKIADGNVTTAKVADSAITDAKLSSDSVTTVKIKDSAVATSKIADKAVTTDKIDDGAITTVKIGAEAITETKISSDAITTTKIKDYAVTKSKLASEVTNWGESLSAEALEQSKAYTDGQVTTLDTKISTARTDLSSYARETSANALAEAKSYTDSEINDLSVELKGDISQEVTDRNTAIEAKGTVLSSYACETSANALVEAKSYTDKKITDLSIADIYETKIDASAKLTEAKTYTDTLSIAVDAKISSARTDLSSYARETSANALAEAKSYTDSEINDLSVELKGDISTEATARKDADDIISGLVTTEEARAKAAEQAIETKVTTLSGEVSAISSNHETRLTAVEDKVAGLSSAMHFKGMATSESLSTGWTGTPVPPYALTSDTPADGDVVIRISDSKEFVWGSNQWNELGDETGLYATKTALEAEVTRAKASESTLSDMINAEVTRAKGIEDGLSTDLYALSGKYDTFTGTTYVADKAALEAVDTEISGKVDNKVKVGFGTFDGTTWSDTLSNKTSLSVIKIADEDYYKLVSAGKQNDDVIYIVSSDYINGHNQRIINVGTAISATDAVNLSGMTSAIDAAKAEIVANALSGVNLNGLDFEVANNVASLQISCINCGTAE